MRRVVLRRRRTALLELVQVVFPRVLVRDDLHRPPRRRRHALDGRRRHGLGVRALHKGLEQLVRAVPRLGVRVGEEGRARGGRTLLGGERRGVVAAPNDVVVVELARAAALAWGLRCGLRRGESRIRFTVCLFNRIRARRPRLSRATPTRRPRPQRVLAKLPEQVVHRRRGAHLQRPTVQRLAAARGLLRDGGLDAAHKVLLGQEVGGEHGAVGGEPFAVVGGELAEEQVVGRGRRRRVGARGALGGSVHRHVGLQVRGYDVRRLPPDVRWAEGRMGRPARRHRERPEAVGGDGKEQLGGLADAPQRRGGRRRREVKRPHVGEVVRVVHAPLDLVPERRVQPVDAVELLLHALEDLLDAGAVPQVDAVVRQQRVLLPRDDAADDRQKVARLVERAEVVLDLRQDAVHAHRRRRPVENAVARKLRLDGAQDLVPVGVERRRNVRNELHQKEVRRLPLELPVRLDLVERPRVGVVEEAVDAVVVTECRDELGELLAVGPSRVEVAQRPLDEPRDALREHPLNVLGGPAREQVAEPDVEEGELGGVGGHLVWVGCKAN